MRRRLVLHPTSPTGFLVGFGLDFSLFARCYWGNPIWFLFLPLLRCFRSGGSRSHLGAPQVPEEPAAGGPIEESPDLRLRASTRGFSQLAAPFFGVQAWPFPRRRFMSGLIGGWCLVGVVWTCAWCSSREKLTPPFTLDSAQRLHVCGAIRLAI